MSIGFSIGGGLCVLWVCVSGQKIDYRRAGSGNLIREKVETGTVGLILKREV